MKPIYHMEDCQRAIVEAVQAWGRDHADIQGGTY